MLEITITIPGLAEGLAAIADAIRNAPAPKVQFPVPEVLLTQIQEPEPKPKRDGRRKTAEVELPPQSSMPVPKLADPEGIRSEMRELMGKAMEIDLRNQNKEKREAIQNILKGIHAESNGKMSGIPEEKLEEAVAQLREFVGNL